MKLYLGGPISSNLSGYRAEFAAAADKLRAEGHEVINPAENPEQPSWHAYMAISLAQLVTCSGIALLKGWEHSRGARLEAHVAAELEMEMIYLE
jgi:Asp-tRNA(Asn)/Glu-tRNA(Gln) amidotransferase A subunit family amidase